MNPLYFGIYTKLYKIKNDFNAPYPPPTEDKTLLQRSGRLFCLTGLYFTMKTLQFFNKTNIFNHEKLLQPIIERYNDTEARPMITVSNHSSTLDDPFTLSCLIPGRIMCSPRYSRYSWCASEICFSSPIKAKLFRLGKGVPITRGEGLNQPGFAEVEQLLLRGEHFNLYPEGKCYPFLQIQKLRW
jgi:monolysocardiolipin acyltransferase